MPAIASLASTPPIRSLFSADILPGLKHNNGSTVPLPQVLSFRSSDTKLTQAEKLQSSGSRCAAICAPDFEAAGFMM